MLLNAVKRLSFGRFLLEMRAHPHNRSETLLRLLHNGEPVDPQPQPKTLKLLRYLADEHPGEELTQDEIADALWPDDSGGNNVQKQASMLRDALDDHLKPYHYINTLPNNRGYKFIAPVHAEGDLGRLDGLLKWSNPRFFDLLGKVRRHDEDAEDLRFATVAFSPSIQDMGFEDLLCQHHVRIRIVLTNPENMELLEARHGLRQDEMTAEDGQAQIKKQIATLARTKARFPNETLEWRLSDAMPCGFVAHSRNWALLGIFPAQGSYVTGPMIEVPGGTELWAMLHDDWNRRWENPAPQSSQGGG
jgi:DNA-binding winged helix-turn-helix (wHTH) protein